MIFNAILCFILGFVTAALIYLFYQPLRRRRRHRVHHARRGTLTIMSKTLNIGGTSTATVAYTDKAGSPVALPAGNVPSWSVDDDKVASVVPSTDGMSAVVMGNAAGTATITVTAEGDPEPGVDTITLTGTVNVVDEASGGTLTFS